MAIQITFTPTELTDKDRFFLLHTLDRFSLPPEDTGPEEAFAQTPPPPAPPTTQGQGPDLEVDASGEPWNPEIHASSKAKTAAGLWRKKRGSEPAPVVKAPEPAPVVQAPEPAPVVKAPNADFIALANVVTAAMGAKKITMDDVIPICVSLGVPSFAALSGRSNLIPLVKAQIDQLIASRG